MEKFKKYVANKGVYIIGYESCYMRINDDYTQIIADWRVILNYSKERCYIDYYPENRREKFVWNSKRHLSKKWNQQKYAHYYAGLLESDFFIDDIYIDAYQCGYKGLNMKISSNIYIKTENSSLIYKPIRDRQGVYTGGKLLRDTEKFRLSCSTDNFEGGKMEYLFMKL